LLKTNLPLKNPRLKFQKLRAPNQKAQNRKIRRVQRLRKKRNKKRRKQLKKRRRKKPKPRKKKNLLLLRRSLLLLKMGVKNQRKRKRKTKPKSEISNPSENGSLFMLKNSSRDTPESDFFQPRS